MADGTPDDTLLLTLGCGKFRFYDHDYGMLPGTSLPRMVSRALFALCCVACAPSGLLGCMACHTAGLRYLPPEDSTLPSLPPLCSWTWASAMMPTPPSWWPPSWLR